jgi:hypothetical protein
MHGISTSTPAAQLWSRYPALARTPGRLTSARPSAAASVPRSARALRSLPQIRRLPHPPGLLLNRGHLHRALGKEVFATSAPRYPGRRSSPGTARVAPVYLELGGGKAVEGDVDGER